MGGLSPTINNRSFASGAKHEARPEKIRSSNRRNIEIYSLTWRTKGAGEAALCRFVETRRPFTGGLEAFVAWRLEYRIFECFR